jgi:predicted nucleotidyltransferase
MKRKTIQVKHFKVKISTVKEALDGYPEVTAAFLFGSTASEQTKVNDLDVLVLFNPKFDKNESYSETKYKLSRDLKIPEDCIDLLSFDLDEAEPSILTRAVNQGILLKNADPDFLGNTIDEASRYLLSNEAMIRRANILRKERVEQISADR